MTKLIGDYRGTWAAIAKATDVHSQRLAHGRLQTMHECMQQFVNAHTAGSLKEKDRRATYMPSDIVVVNGPDEILYIREPEAVSQGLTPMGAILDAVLRPAHVVLDEGIIAHINTLASPDPTTDVVRVPIKYNQGTEYKFIPSIYVGNAPHHPVMLAMAKGNANLIRDYFAARGSSQAKLRFGYNNDSLQNIPIGTRLDLVAQSRYSFQSPCVEMHGFDVRTPFRSKGGK